MRELIRCETATIAFKSVNNIAPEYLSHLFIRSSECDFVELSIREFRNSSINHGLIKIEMIKIKFEIMKITSASFFLKVRAIQLARYFGICFKKGLHSKFWLHQKTQNVGPVKLL